MNPVTGGSYLAAYLKVGRITYDRDNRLVEFILLTYNSKADRDASREPITFKRFSATGAEFDANFTPSSLDASGNIVKRIYEYLSQVIDEEGNLLYPDWESDVM